LIGLTQLDGKIPNLALMKIAGYHKQRGDEVDWWNGPLFPCEKVYASKIFDFTEDHLPDYIIRGGTGYSHTNKLPEEIEVLDHAGGWFLYPKYLNHIGFSERGCRLNCSFCVVPEKEGKPTKEMSIGDLLSNPKGQDRLVLLDDDFLGHPDCLEVFKELIDRKLKVCFLQGLNIRLITEDQARLLAQVKFYNTGFTSRMVTFAWDRHKDRKKILSGFQRCLEAGIKAYEMQFFVLIGYDTEEAEDLERIETIRDLGALPFVMPYNKSIHYQKKLARWVNHRAIFRTVSWAEYRG